MAVSVLNQFYDINMLLTISLEQEGETITANFFRMIGLALNDPEGCVRSIPSVNMDAEAFSKYFHSSVSSVLMSIQALTKLNLITMEDGKIYITLLREQKMKKAAALAKAAKAAEERAKGAARTAACRANKKLAALGGETVSQPADEKNSEVTTEKITATPAEKNSATVAEKTPASGKENPEVAAVPSGQNKFTKAIQEKPPERCEENIPQTPKELIDYVTNKATKILSDKFDKVMQKKPAESYKENFPETAMENVNGNVTEPVTENHRNTVTEPSSSNYGKPFAENAESRSPSGVAGTENKTCNAKCNAPCNVLENGENHNYNYNNYNNYNLLINDNDNYDNYPNYPNYDNYNYAGAGKSETSVTDKGSPHLPVAAQNNLPVLAEENGGSCLPFCPGDYYDNSQLIPLDKLPVQARRVLEAWNNLKLKHFKGLYNSIAERLCEVLYKYGEEAFLKVIENVKNSPYLMGRNSTSNRWRATFTWLLKEKNFLNVLNGKYNRYSGGDSAYGYTGDYYQGGNYNDVPPGIPGCENRADMTPEERKQAYHEYMRPHNELLDEMARDFGVTY